MSELVYLRLAVTVPQGSGTYSITIPVTNFIGKIYWGDGTNNTYTVATTNITKTYTRNANGNFNYDIDFVNVTNLTSMPAPTGTTTGNINYRTALISFKYINKIVTFTSFEGLFRGCTNFVEFEIEDNESLVSSSDPNHYFYRTNNVTNMSYMFSGATNFVSGTITALNTINVTNMSYMFQGATKFNDAFFGGIFAFNTQNVTNMRDMFSGASSFNRPVPFDTQNVTTMQNMFLNATSFNQSINFNSSKVTNMNDMFNGATSLNETINLDTSKVTTMTNMFNGTTSFSNKFISNSGTLLTNATDVFKNSSYYDEFIVIKVKIPASSSTVPITLPIVGFMGTIHWGDETFNSYYSSTSGAVTKNYAVSSIEKTYDIVLSNVLKLTSMSISDTPTNGGPTNYRNYITSFEYKNRIFSFTSWSRLFNNATNLIEFKVDVTNAETEFAINVSTMSKMFYNATSFNNPLPNFICNSLTDVSSMFEGATLFNNNIVIQPREIPGTINNASNMFKGASSFNSILNINVENATNMSSLFENAISFNKEINFNTVNATNMSNMFKGATAFNSPVDFNSMNNVTTIESMFENATNFNNFIGFYQKTEFVQNMANLFKNATSFNSATNNNGGFQLYTNSVINMSSMFEGATSFNKPVNFSTSNVTTTENMFKNATSFNENIDFDLTNVTTTVSMFENASSFNKPIYFNAPNVTTLKSMFQNASSFNSSFFIISTTKATTFESMFQNAISFNKPVDLDCTNVTNISNMFNGAINFESSYNFNNMRKLTNMTNAFLNVKERKYRSYIEITLDLSNNITSGNQNAIQLPVTASTFIGLIDWGDGSSLISFESTTAPKSAIKTYSNIYTTVNPVIKLYDVFLLSAFSLSETVQNQIRYSRCVKNFANNILIPSFNNYFKLFNEYTILNNITLQANENVTDTSFMFKNAKSYDGNGFEFLLNTSNVTNMSYMFQGATLFNYSLILNTSKVTNMSFMFEGASSFNELIEFDTSKVTNMSYMFQNARAFNKPLRFNTSNVTNMSYMFKGASSFNQSVNFDTSKVTTMQAMFQDAIAFNKPISFSGNELITAIHMFSGSSSSINMNFDSSVNITNTLKLTSLASMFRHNKVFNKPVTFNIPRVVGTTATTSSTNGSGLCSMFEGAIKFNSPVNLIIYDENYTAVSNNNISLFKMFYDAKEFNSIVNINDLRNVTNLSYMFYGSEKYNTAFTSAFENSTTRVTDMSYMFYSATNFNQSINFITNSVTNLSYMFYNCKNFNSSLGSNFTNNTTNVTSTLSMFELTSNFNKEINMNLSKCTNLNCMFKFAEKFDSSVNIILSTDASINITLTEMFNGAVSFNSSLIFNSTERVTSMQSMFYNAAKFNIDISFNTQRVANMQTMFYGAGDFNKDVNFNTSSVTNFFGMFNGAKSFNKAINFNIQSVSTPSFTTNPGNTAMVAMLNNTKISINNYALILNNFVNSGRTGLVLDALGLYYNDTIPQTGIPSGKASRDILTKSIANGGRGWNIRYDASTNLVETILDFVGSKYIAKTATDNSFKVNVSTNLPNMVRYRALEYETNLENASITNNIAKVDQSGNITIFGSGYVVIEAYIDASLNYAAAKDSLLLYITKANSNITLNNISNDVIISDYYDISFNIIASSNNNELPLEYYIIPNEPLIDEDTGLTTIQPNNVTVNNEGKITFLETGFSYVKVYQTETTYSKYSTVEKIFKIYVKKQPTYVVDSSYNVFYNSTLSLSNQTTNKYYKFITDSIGTLSFASSNSNVIIDPELGTIEGNIIGSSIITVTQTETDYNFAGLKTFIVNVLKSPTTLSIFSQTSNIIKTYGDTSFNLFEYVTLDDTNYESFDYNFIYDSSYIIIDEIGQIEIKGAVSSTNILVYVPESTNYDESNTISIPVVINKKQTSIELDGSTNIIKYFADGSFNMKDELNIRSNNSEVEFTYFTSDSSCAIIDTFGNVTILKSGLVTFNIKQVNASNYTDASLNIYMTVLKSDPVITYDQSKVELIENKPFIFKTYDDVNFILKDLLSINTSNNETNLQFYSSHTNIASIDINSSEVDIKLASEAITNNFYFTIVQEESTNFNHKEILLYMKVNKRDVDISFNEISLLKIDNILILNKTLSDTSFNLYNIIGPITSNNQNSEIIIFGDNSLVADVSTNGTVIINAYGECNISITQGETDNYNYAIRTIKLVTDKIQTPITVKDASGSLVTSFTKITDSAPFNIANEFVISSSNNETGFIYGGGNINIATIDTSGNVNIIGPGTVQFSIHQNETSTYKANTQYITLVVKTKTVISVKNNGLEINDITKTFGDSDFDLSSEQDYVLTTNNTESQIIYASENTNIVEIDNNGLVKIKDSTINVGYVNIYITQEESESFSKTIKTIKLYINRANSLVNISYILNTIETPILDGSSISINYTLSNITLKSTSLNNNLTPFIYSIQDASNNRASINESTGIITINSTGTTNLVVSQLASTKYNSFTRIIPLTISKANPNLISGRGTLLDTIPTTENTPITTTYLTDISFNLNTTTDNSETSVKYEFLNTLITNAASLQSVATVDTSGNTAIIGASVDLSGVFYFRIYQDATTNYNAINKYIRLVVNKAQGTVTINNTTLSSVDASFNIISGVNTFTWVWSPTKLAFNILNLLNITTNNTDDLSYNFTENHNNISSIDRFGNVTLVSSTPVSTSGVGIRITKLASRNFLVSSELFIRVNIVRTTAFISVGNQTITKKYLDNVPFNMLDSLHANVNYNNTTSLFTYNLQNGVTTTTANSIVTRDSSGNITQILKPSTTQLVYRLSQPQTNFYTGVTASVATQITLIINKADNIINRTTNTLTIPYTNTSFNLINTYGITSRNNTQNLPSGIIPGSFSFTSDKPSIASIDSSGNVQIKDTTDASNNSPVTFVINQSSNEYFVDASNSVTLFINRIAPTITADASFVTSFELNKVINIRNLVTSTSSGLFSYQINNLDVATIDNSGNLTIKKSTYNLSVPVKIIITQQESSIYSTGTKEIDLIIIRVNPVISLQTNYFEKTFGTDGSFNLIDVVGVLANGVKQISSTSDGLITYAKQDPSNSVADIDSVGNVTILSAGITRFIITQQETNDYLTTTAFVDMKVATATSTITLIKNSVTKTFGDDLSFNILNEYGIITINNETPLVYTILTNDSSLNSITITDNIVNILNAGIVKILISQNGSTNYEADNEIVSLNILPKMTELKATNSTITRTYGDFSFNLLEAIDISTNNLELLSDILNPANWIITPQQTEHFSINNNYLETIKPTNEPTLISLTNISSRNYTSSKVDIYLNVSKAESIITSTYTTKTKLISDISFNLLETYEISNKAGEKELSQINNLYTFTTNSANIRLDSSGNVEMLVGNSIKDTQQIPISIELNETEYFKSASYIVYLIINRNLNTINATALTKNYTAFDSFNILTSYGISSFNLDTANFDYYIPNAYAEFITINNSTNVLEILKYSENVIKFYISQPQTTNYYASSQLELELSTLKRDNIITSSNIVKKYNDDNFTISTFSLNTDISDFSFNIIDDYESDPTVADINVNNISGNVKINKSGTIKINISQPTTTNFNSSNKQITLTVMKDTPILTYSDSSYILLDNIPTATGNEPIIKTYLTDESFNLLTTSNNTENNVKYQILSDVSSNNAIINTIATVDTNGIVLINGSTLDMSGVFYFRIYQEESTNYTEINKYIRLVVNKAQGTISIGNKNPIGITSNGITNSVLFTDTSGNNELKWYWTADPSHSNFNILELLQIQSNNNENSSYTFSESHNNIGPISASGRVQLNANAPSNGTTGTGSGITITKQSSKNFTASPSLYIRFTLLRTNAVIKTGSNILDSTFNITKQYLDNSFNIINDYNINSNSNASITIASDRTNLATVSSNRIITIVKRTVATSLSPPVTLTFSQASNIYYNATSIPIKLTINKATAILSSQPIISPYIQDASINLRFNDLSNNTFNLKSFMGITSNNNSTTNRNILSGTDPIFNYTSSNTSVATINNTTGFVEILSTTDAFNDTPIIFTVTQPSDAYFESASIIFSMTVNRIETNISTPNTITMPYSKEPFNLASIITSNSDQPIIYSISDQSIGNINSSGNLTITRTTVDLSYNVYIIVEQQENDKYLYQTKQIPLIINRANTLITSAKNSLTKKYGETNYFNIRNDIDISSNNTESEYLYEISNDSIAIIDYSSGFVNIKDIGTTDITIKQQQSLNYLESNPIVITFTVNKGDSNITFNKSSIIRNFSENKYFNIHDLLDISSNNPIPNYLYDVSNNGIATIDGSGNVIINKAGKTTFTITQPENAYYLNGSKTIEMTVVKSTTTILANNFRISYQDIPFNVLTKIDISSNNPDSVYMFEGTNDNIATIDEYGNINILKSGTVSFIITQNENESFFYGSTSIEMTVDKIETVIEGNNVVKKYGDVPFNILTEADISSNNPSQDYLFDFSDNDVVEIDNSGNVNILKIGSIILFVKQIESINYLESNNKEIIITIDKIDNIINSSANALIKTFGQSTFNLKNELLIDSLHNETPFAYTSSDSSFATIDNSGNVTIIKPTTSPIELIVSQINATNYTDASINIQFTINKSPNIIDVSTNSLTKLYSDVSFNLISEYGITSTNNKNLPSGVNPTPFSFTSSDPYIASINENGIVTINDASNVTFTITQISNEYFDSSIKEVYLYINKDTPTINIIDGIDISNGIIDTIFQINKTINIRNLITSVSNGEFSYQIINNSDVASIDSSGILTINKSTYGLSSTIIRITQAQTSKYNMTTKDILLNIRRATPMINLNTINFQKYANDLSFNINSIIGVKDASSNEYKIDSTSDGIFTYTKDVSNNVADIDNSGNVTISSSGIIDFEITQEETANYISATFNVTMTVLPVGAALSITTNTLTKIYGTDASFNIESAYGVFSLNKDSLITYSIIENDSSSNTISIINKEANILNAGVVTIFISQDANDSYEADSRIVTLYVLPQTTILNAKNIIKAYGDFSFNLIHEIDLSTNNLDISSNLIITPLISSNITQPYDFVSINNYYLEMIKPTPYPVLISISNLASRNYTEGNVNITLMINKAQPVIDISNNNIINVIGDVSFNLIERCVITNKAGQKLLVQPNNAYKYSQNSNDINIDGSGNVELLVGNTTPIPITIRLDETDYFKSADSVVNLTVNKKIANINIANNLTQNDTVFNKFNILTKYGISSNNTDINHFEYNIPEQYKQYITIDTSKNELTINKYNSTPISFYISQPQTLNYYSVSQKELLLTTTKKQNEIYSSNIINKKYNDINFTIDVSSSNTDINDFSFSLIDMSGSDITVAEIIGNFIKIKKTGSVKIYISQTATTNFTSANKIVTLNVIKDTPILSTDLSNVLLDIIPSSTSVSMIKTYLTDISFNLKITSNNPELQIKYEFLSDISSNDITILNNIATVDASGNVHIKGATVDLSGVFYFRVYQEDSFNYNAIDKYIRFVVNKTQGTIAIINKNPTGITIDGIKNDVSFNDLSGNEFTWHWTPKHRTFNILNILDISNNIGNNSYIFTHNHPNIISIDVSGTVQLNTASPMNIINSGITITKTGSNNYTESSPLFIRFTLLKTRSILKTNSTLLEGSFNIIKTYLDTSFNIINDYGINSNSDASINIISNEERLATVSNKIITLVKKPVIDLSNVTLTISQDATVYYDSISVPITLILNKANAILTKNPIISPYIQDSSINLQFNDLSNNTFNLNTFMRINSNNNSTTNRLINGDISFNYISSNTSIATINNYGVVQILTTTDAVNNSLPITFTVIQPSDTYFNQGSIVFNMIVRRATTNISSPNSINTTFSKLPINIGSQVSSNSDETILYSVTNQLIATIDGSGILSINKSTVDLSSNVFINILQQQNNNYEYKLKQIPLIVNKASAMIFSNNNTTSITKGYTDPNFSLSSAIDISSNHIESSYIYNSSNNSIATIDSSTGMVVIRGIGQTTFSVKQIVSSNYLESNTLYITMIVNKTNATIFSNNNTTSITKIFKEPNFSLSSAIDISSNHTESGYIYDSSNSNVAAIDASSGFVTVKNVGQTVLSVRQAVSTNYPESNTLYIIINVNKAMANIFSNNNTTSIAKIFKDPNFSLSSAIDISSNHTESAYVYNSSNSNVASIDVSSGMVMIKGTGQTTFSIKQITSSNYLESNMLYITMNVNKAMATIISKNNTTSITKMYNDSSFSLSSVIDISSNHTESTYLYNSSNNSIATIDSSSGFVTIKGAGQTTLSVKQITSSNYLESNILYITMNVNKNTATIFSNNNTTSIIKVFKDTDFNLSTAIDISSNHTESGYIYNSSNSNVASIDASSGMVTIKSAGQTILTVKQTTSNNYGDSNTLSITMTVNKNNATIFSNNNTASITKVFKDPNFSLSTAIDISSNHTESTYLYNSSNSNIAAVDASSGIVTIKNAGQTTLSIKQIASTNYLESNTLYITIQINKAVATIVQTNVINIDRKFGDNFNLSEKIDISSNHTESGYTYDSSNSDVAIIDVSSGMVTIKRVGKTTFSIMQKASINYEASNKLYIDMVVSKADTVIYYNENKKIITKKLRTNNFSLTNEVSLSSNHNENNFIFNSSNSNIATIDASSGIISIINVGKTFLTATKTETINYLSENVSFELNIEKATNLLSVNNNTISKKLTDEPFILKNVVNISSYHSESGYTYDSSNIEVAIIDSSSGMINILGIGTTTISVKQNSSPNYDESNTIYINMHVNNDNVKTEFEKTYGDIDFNLLDEIDLSSNDIITYSCNNDNVAIIDVYSGIVSLTGAGIAIFTVNVIPQTDEIKTYFIVMTVKKAETTIIYTNNIIKTYGVRSFYLSSISQILSNNMESEFSYSSGNENIAEVDIYGNVTINSIGVVTLKIYQDANNKYEYGEKLVILTINKEETIIGGINFTKILGDSSFNLIKDALVFTNNKESKYVFSSSNDNNATIDFSGNVSILKSGVVLFNVFQEESENYTEGSKEIKMTVLIPFNDDSSIEQPDEYYININNSDYSISDLLYINRTQTTSKNFQLSPMSFLQVNLYDKIDSEIDPELFPVIKASDINIKFNTFKNIFYFKFRIYSLGYAILNLILNKYLKHLIVAKYIDEYTKKTGLSFYSMPFNKQILFYKEIANINFLSIRKQDKLDMNEINNIVNTTNVDGKSILRSEFNIYSKTIDVGLKIQFDFIITLNI